MPRYHNECPHVMRKPFGDEAEDNCEMSGQRCLLELGQHCATWAEIQNEWAKEAAADEAHYLTVNYPGGVRCR